MKERAILFVLLHFLLTAVAHGAVVDQSQYLLKPDSGGDLIGPENGQILAQIVTAGISGALTGIGLPVAGNGSGTLTLQIEGVSGNLPNGTVLASQNFDGANLPIGLPDPSPFVLLILATPVNFSAGEKFAFVLSASSGDFFAVLPGAVGDTYPGGDAFYQGQPLPPGQWAPLDSAGPTDLPFETLVEPAPEPGSANLVLMGCVFALILQTRKRLRNSTRSSFFPSKLRASAPPW